MEEDSPTQPDTFRILERHAIEYCGVDGPLKYSTRLHYDLGLVGLDAYDFMNWYAETFKVDLSGLNADNYFREEPEPLSRLIDWISGNTKPKKVITLRHLMNGIQTRHLNDLMIKENSQ